MVGALQVVLRVALAYTVPQLCECRTCTHTHHTPHTPPPHTHADNNISECGIASLLTTVRYQTSVFTAQAPGLLALTLHHNHLVPPTSSMLATLHDLLEQRNPLKVAETDPVIDTVESGT